MTVLIIGWFILGFMASVIWHIHEQPNKVTLNSIVLVLFGTMGGLFTAVCTIVNFLDDYGSDIVLWKKKDK